MAHKNTTAAASAAALAPQPDPRRKKSNPAIGKRPIFRPDEYHFDPDEAAAGNGESCFRAIADNAKDGIMISATAGGPYVYANQRASEISGFPISELLDLAPARLLAPAAARSISDDRRSQRRFSRRYETVIQRRDGEAVPVEVTESHTIWQGRPAALFLLRDITLGKLESEMGRLNSELEKRMVAQTSELSATEEMLVQKQDEILRQKLELERANHELVQTNTALSVLAKNIDQKKNELEQKIAHQISSQLLPLIEEISRDTLREKTRVQLEVLATRLINLTPGISKSREVIAALTPMELEIAVLVKKDFSSEDIARLLHLSPHTVKSHRRNIRKKLSLRNSDTNLASFLKLKFEPAHRSQIACRSAANE